MNPIHQKKELLSKISSTHVQELLVIILTLIFGIFVMITSFRTDDDTMITITALLWWAFVVTGIIHGNKLKKIRITLEEELRTLDEEHFL